ncbi:MAG TPA: thioredoxin domain-containing protein [Rhizomicrobium sp.]|nr:thioredoxin domain-containing protein [Rhizomicrobium sp.]
MALKDRLNDALNETPPENAARLETLRSVLSAAGGGSDAEVRVALTRIISEREQRAASFSAAGQSELARTERAEIDALRGFLRLASPEAPATPKKSDVPSTAAAPAANAPLFSRTQMIIGGVAVVALAVIVFLLLRPSGESEAVLPANAGPAKISLLKDDRTMGSPDAPIKMLEYAAPTCPHCAHFAMTVMPLIKQQYIDTGKMFYIFRTFPLSAADGAVESIARACLPADKYFQFIDLMFRNQPKWDPDGYQIADVGAAIKNMARVMGVGPEQADRCMTDKSEQERINQVAQDAMTRYNIQGTPTFVINGTVVQATEASWPELKARIDSLLSKK